MVTYEPVLPVASALLAAFSDLLEGSDAPVCAAGFGFGLPPPADYCCDCSGFTTGPPSRSGQAWVRVGPVWLSRVFPEPVTIPAGGNGCDEATLAAAISLGVYRCAPTLDDGGRPPTPDAIAAALDRQLQDAALMRAAVAASFGAGGQGLDLPYIPGTWEPREPGGGCMGGALTITVLVC